MDILKQQDLPADSDKLLPRNRFKNPVLFKHEIGKAKKSAYDLPDKNFTYGRSPLPDKEGAGAVVMNWDFPLSSKQPKAPRDFTKLNKMALQEKVFKSKSISNYRKEHDARIQVKEGKKGYELEIPHESFRYGMSNKPSTPISNIICNSYGNYSEKFMLENYEQRKQQKKYLINQSYDKVRAGGLYIRPDRGNEERIKQLDQFKLAKYQSVDSKINGAWKQKPNMAHKLPPLDNSNQQQEQQPEQQYQQEQQQYEQQESL